MGSGSSKESARSSNSQRTVVRPQATTSRRGDFQEVEVRPTGQGQGENMSSSRNPEGQRDSRSQPPEAGRGGSNRYARHAASPTTNSSSLQHGQTGAATSRSNGRNRSDLQEADVVFETFVHKNGREFICAVRNGRRYYLDDWHSHEWQPFPERWYSEGRIVPMDDSGQSNETNESNNQSRSNTNNKQEHDDREGYLKHPKRGRIETYLMEERHYVHFFFDRQSGKWLRLPIGWELHHHLVRQMVDHVEEALPHWKDRADILALLRACNYNPDECIGTYLMLEGDEADWLKPQRTSKEAKADEDKDTRIEELTEKLKKLERELETEKKQRAEAEKQLSDLEEKYGNISAEATSAQRQMEAMQQSRPKTARPKTPVAVKTSGASIDEMDQLNRKVKNLHKSHVHLKMDVLRNIGSVNAVIKEAMKAAADLKKSDIGSQHELEEVRALYQREALQRRLLYNQLQELRGNIRVFCRPRRDDKADNCLKFPSDQDVMAVNADGSKKTFSYDKVFTPDTTQEQIFTDTQPIITSCVDGYNVCLLAYGQTGSGKTFTMMGPENNPGINIRAITELLKVCSERTETKKYKLKISMVEIYNETVQDLLTTDARTLELQMVGNIVRIPNITEMEVTAVKDIKEIMKLGDGNRKTASTKMNSTSSRSHLVLMITVEGEDKVTGAISKGVLTLCDLAGSERISKTEASGQRLVEAAAINKSLSALGQVFSALRESQLHVPYRNSKLTQILRPCLGGDAKACLFVNISPDVRNYPETCNTLEFGSNARQVALGQAKQNIQRKPGGFPPR
ncbi:kinesin-like protein KIN-14D [Aplysia californica]|uniref:Kinesin-like protein n=1 Tax=Aplysia californica TaxID=6500 RepID=A0ABM1VUR3_APLCA|nr:kinesin-like protein KIN-14D [Aplysia californica]